MNGRTALTRLACEIEAKVSEARGEVAKEGMGACGYVALPVEVARVVAAALRHLDVQAAVLEVALGVAAAHGDYHVGALHVCLDADRKLAGAAGRLAGEN